ncbi:MAG: type IV toxin-antitoxin system AbiEi family antitoxin domain-containing protein [Lachnospiraceae bacterium]|nr:type IV toxin-antitoxin system AbiEi family antitoxin domain-containing protein [Lachnospiraceae bacterium]
MLQRTYDKVNALFEKSNGYLSTRELLENKITTIQIRSMLDDGKIEKISHGHYWSLMSGKKKPKNYKMIEACMTNPRAVICSLSACYYHGLIKKEPEKLYVATARTDRGGMKLTFPVSRHYFSLLSFDEDVENVKTDWGNIKVYGVDRSVCDCIRLEKEIGHDQVELVVENYKKYKKQKMDHLLDYADRMRFGKIAREYLGQSQ